MDGNWMERGYVDGNRKVGEDRREYVDGGEELVGKRDRRIFAMVGGGGEVCARLAQLVRSLTANQEVPGSSPGLVEG